MWVLQLLFHLLCVAEGKMEVIGAGMGRTGTTSLKAALEQLGFGVTHHMKEVFQSLPREGFAHVDAWVEIQTSPSFEKRKELLDKLFTNSMFHSIVDQPGSLYYRELATLYPNAKVILTERDSPEAWFKSVYDSIGHFMMASSTLGFWRDPGVWLLFRLNPVFHRISPMMASMQVPRNLDRDTYVAFYKNWSLGVREYFKDDPDRLLIFNAKQGWEPLCKFLNVPVPSTPYPRVNESEGMQRMVLLMNAVGVLHLLVALWLCRWVYRKAKGLLCPAKEEKNKTS